MNAILKIMIDSIPKILLKNNNKNTKLNIIIIGREQINTRIISKDISLIRNLFVNFINLFIVMCSFLMANTNKAHDMDVKYNEKKAHNDIVIISRIMFLKLNRIA
jgi:hypothetical protein